MKRLKAEWMIQMHFNMWISFEDRFPSVGDEIIIYEKYSKFAHYVDSFEFDTEANYSGCYWCLSP